MVQGAQSKEQLHALLRNAKMSGLSLFDVQEITYISMVKAGVASRDAKWIECIGELEKVYFCAWLLTDEEGLADCEFMLMRTCFEVGSLQSAQRFALLLSDRFASNNSLMLTCEYNRMLIERQLLMAAAQSNEKEQEIVQLRPILDAYK